MGRNKFECSAFVFFVVEYVMSCTLPPICCCECWIIHDLHYFECSQFMNEKCPSINTGMTVPVDKLLQFQVLFELQSHFSVQLSHYLKILYQPSPYIFRFNMPHAEMMLQVILNYKLSTYYFTNTIIINITICQQPFSKWISYRVNFIYLIALTQI